MSAAFRQRTPAEYLQLAWRNKWLVILPTIAVALATAWVVRKLPNIYESSSLLILRPATITSVGRMEESALILRINAYHQQVVSRSSLEPLIRRYGLYKDELARGASIESLVSRMQSSDVRVAIDRTNERPNSFNISFRASDPAAARNVTAELASKYVNAQLEGGRKDANENAEFFNTRVNEVKAQLEAIAQRRSQFMQGNLGQLPDELAPLSQRLTGLYEQQKAWLNETGRTRESIRNIETQIEVLNQARAEQIADVSENYVKPRETPAYAALTSRKLALEAELSEMRRTLTEKNPDVIAKKEQLAAVTREINDSIEEGERVAEARRQQLQNRVNLPSKGLQMQAQAARSELRRQETALAQTGAQISELERRLNAVPGVAVALENMDREYATAKAAYDSLQTQASTAILSSAVNSESKGETIQVIDSASTPERPVAPKRELLYMMGIALGLSVGVLLAVARELPRLMTVQNTADAEHYTALPVLVSLPEVLTPRERRMRQARRLTFATAGLALAVLSVPGLILLFRYTRLFNILGGVN